MFSLRGQQGNHHLAGSLLVDVLLRHALFGCPCAPSL